MLKLSILINCKFLYFSSTFQSPLQFDSYLSIQIQKHQFGETLIFINRPEVKIIISIFLIRMRTATSKFVTVFDVCVVVGACLCGAITGIVGRKFIQKINSNLTKVCHHVNPAKDISVDIIQYFRLTMNWQYLTNNEKTKDGICLWY